MRIAPQMQWSDIKPDPVEINEMTDVTMEILVNECIIEVPDGWEFEQIVIHPWSYALQA